MTTTIHLVLAEFSACAQPFEQLREAGNTVILILMHRNLRLRGSSNLPMAIELPRTEQGL